MYNCKCGNDIHPKRFELGYKICIDCSEESPKSCIMISNHKTGNEIQIVSQETAENFRKISSRSSYGIMNGIKNS
tara:strand:+ start:723 stop:947 length:225 start_codon:yes stop_codon:yes gene_type:complete